MTFVYHFKPTHKEIKTYYEELAGYATHEVAHEGATSSAFQNLLAATCKKADWHLVPQLSTRIRGKQVRPDGTLRDEFNLHHGYWEAKDSSDKLDEEIRKKIALGYPLSNTIFEDTSTAVLYQNGKQVEPRFDIRDPQQLCDLLNLFYSHIEPDIEGFEQAVEDFKERVPQLALALKDKIEEAHKKNKKFQEAFDTFFELCRQSLNPNLSPAAVDEMLIQHLLTIRLFDTIFDNPDFVRRNVIAAEVEKVIDALASKAFSREQFLKSLDRFYVAIESAARVLGDDFTEKQHFLNTVYERFFQGYSVKVADTHGIVYTPQEVVDFMCASVEEVLKTEFGKTLGSKDVNILDPCTGTGNFIVNLLRRVPKKDLKRVYANQLFANEVMLLPYYIAALNIEHSFWELTGEYEGFEGLCFVDTLDLQEKKQQQLGFMTEKNTERVARQKATPITVVIGNPPYNMGQQNENDNNKNRKYSFVDDRIRDTYAKGSNATLSTKLYDAYVRFFRWAADRLGTRPGILCFITNNGFFHGIAFDAFRREMGRDFTALWHFDLKGNARTSGARRQREGGNVFDDKIRTGVGISVFVRTVEAKPFVVRYHTVGDYWKSTKKKLYVAESGSIQNTPWTELVIDRRHNWLEFADSTGFEDLTPIGSKFGKAGLEAETIFAEYSPGANTARDLVVYCANPDSGGTYLEQFVESYNSELDRFKRLRKKVEIDKFVDYKKLKWSRNLKRALKKHIEIEFDRRHWRRALYRPFVARQMYYADFAVDEPGRFDRYTGIGSNRFNNNLISVPNIGSNKPPYCFITDTVADFHLTGDAQCFPFYVYKADGTNRRENITDWALQHFREHYNDKKITKWDIFYYVYGILQRYCR